MLKTKISIAIIGCSGHYSYVLDNLPDQCILTAVAPGHPDENMTHLYNTLKGFSIKYYINWRDLLKIHKPDIVVVNSWFGLNGTITIEALLSGSHVFSEKPLSGEISELSSIKREWSRSNFFVGGMFGISYTAPFVTLYNYIKTQMKGNIRLINVRKSYKINTREDFYKSRNTYTGTIPWVGSHGVDWILRVSEKHILRGSAFHIQDNDFGYGEMESAAVCNYALEDNVLAQISIDYFRPHGALSHGDDRLRVVTTKEIIEIQNGQVSVIDNNNEYFLPLLDSKCIFTEFVTCIEDGLNREVWFNHAYEVTLITLLSREAADGSGFFFNHMSNEPY